MEAFYQGTYCDQYGEEAIIIRNDGQEMRTTIRGIEIITEWFFDDPDILTPNETYPPLALLPNDTGRWWTLTCNFPLTVITNERELIANLKVEIT